MLADRIRIFSDMPLGVLGLEAVGDIEKDDCKDVIGRAVEAAIAEHGRIGLVCLIGHDFDEYEGGAVWEDLKLGMRHPASMERAAIVSDGRWARPAV